MLRREFGSDLDRINASPERATADYRWCNGRLIRSVEVKEITVDTHRQLVAEAKAGKTARDSTTLSMRWMIMINLPTLSTVLEPMPSFPPDDPELAADVEQFFGARMMTRAEREAEWRRTHPGPKHQPTPQIKNLGRDLDPHLLVLEQHGIVSTHGPRSEDPAVAAALWAIAMRTHGAICMAHNPVRDEKPGIDVAFVAGYVRTERADVLVDRVELWLHNDDHSKNVRTSLTNEPSTERHAVLVFDHQTEPEYWSATEQGVGFCPTRDLQLPDAIDVLWIIIGPIACRFSASEGWRALRMPDEETTAPEPGANGAVE
ncbi:hypothetical protein [Amycolatopsis sp. NPDC059021]|uniref:hypothetical protein n=1 Tax=Amycolatopsis sp. NPDC059021 TaxID=3346704 RepID=UPI00366CF7F7